MAGVQRGPLGERSVLADGAHDFGGAAVGRIETAAAHGDSRECDGRPGVAADLRRLTKSHTLWQSLSYEEDLQDEGILRCSHGDGDYPPGPGSVGAPRRLRAHSGSARFGASGPRRTQASWETVYQTENDLMVSLQYFVYCE